MKTILKPIAWALLGAGAAAMTGASAFDLPWLSKHDAASTTAAPAAGAAATTAPNPPLPAGTAPNFRSIVEQAAPAVVGVTVEGVRKVGFGDVGPGGNGDQLHHFFFGFPPGFGQPQEQPFRGQGSGFIIASDGLILTNAHVVKDAKQVTVQLQDRRQFSAKVLGTDPATDIAVLRIDAKNLPTVHIGNPATLMVGDPVLAIGAPFGLEETATAGIVSAKGRSLPGDAFVPFIQTDAAVNPGNSGGPLFDGAGNVVGINSQIYTRSGGYQGLSFAIPINVAMKVSKEIIATGHAEHARLGVMVQNMDQNLAESFGLTSPDGALVAQVDPKSPAAAAGLKPGDVITKYDGTPLIEAGSLSSRVGMATPGQKVKLTVWRDHAAREIDVTLGKLSESSQAQAQPASADSQGKLGLALRPLDRAERKEAQVDHGMLVQDAEGAAAQAGVQAGDVVLAINGHPVDSIGDLTSVLAKKPKSVALLLWRDGQRLFVPVPLA